MRETMSNDIRVLLYYKYVPIENAENYAKEHLAFCKSIGLKGRILIADEGITILLDSAFWTSAAGDALAAYEALLGAGTALLRED